MSPKGGADLSRVGAKEINDECHHPGLDRSDGGLAPRHDGLVAAAGQIPEVYG